MRVDEIGLALLEIPFQAEQCHREVHSMDIEALKRYADFPALMPSRLFSSIFSRDRMLRSYLSLIYG